jgi:hypothetical protein
MAGYTVWGHTARLESAFERASKVVDLEVQADLARFLVVLMSGFLEKAIAHHLAEYARRAGGSEQVIKYMQRRLETFQNPNAEKILQLTGDFDSSWREALEEYLEAERKDHVDSVVANRNQIAHGANVGVTYFRALAYFTSVKETVAFVDGLCR